MKCDGCPECMIDMRVYPAVSRPDPNSDTCRTCQAVDRATESALRKLDEYGITITTENNEKEMKEMENESKQARENTEGSA